MGEKGKERKKKGGRDKEGLSLRETKLAMKREGTLNLYRGKRGHETAFA